MKKILVILALFTVLIACKNQDYDFPDYIYTAAYFPYQYPVRTLVLGDYIFDNTMDNNHKCLISADFGGVYENKMDRVIDFEVYESLCDSVLFESTKDTIRLMPASYYSLSSSEKIIIPAGKFNGSIEVQLNDAFFNDTLAYRLGYVIPLRIVGSTDVDSILRGKTNKVNPDPRNVKQWDIVPKDYTMFAVKFINPYHGKYLHRGVSLIKNVSNAVIETNPYRTPFIVDNEIWSLLTTGKNQVSVTGSLHSTKVPPGPFKMLLTFSDDGNCTITQGKGSVYTITGNGKFSTGADTWGNKKRDAIHLNYSFSNGVNTYNATDTLVLRDRAVVLQVYKPTLIPK